MRSRLPIFLIALLAATTPSQATAFAVGWTPVTPAVPRSEPAGGGVGLLDIAATAATDVWALGGSWAGHRNFVTHWDGKTWILAPALDIAGYAITLEAIDAVAASSMWVAGHRRLGGGQLGGTSTAVVATFDGAIWTVAPTPPPAEGTSYFLRDIDMTSAGQGLAVGYSFRYAGNLIRKPLILRWDGGQWTEAVLPGISGDDLVLDAVNARTANDVWAVGRSGDTTLIMHWDGSHWRQISGPPTGVGSQLRAVKAISGTDVWAVGATCVWVDDPGFESCHPLALHLADGGWQVVATVGGTFLVDVVARSSGDVWAVGYNKPATGGFEANHVQHWDGLRFTTLSAIPVRETGPIGTLDGLASALSAIIVIPGSGELWAAGWIVEQIGSDGASQVIRHG